MARKGPEKFKGNGANVGYEAQFWQKADTLRGFRHFVTGFEARQSSVVTGVKPSVVSHHRG